MLTAHSNFATSDNWCMVVMLHLADDQMNAFALFGKWRITHIATFLSSYSSFILCFFV